MKHILLFCIVFGFTISYAQDIEKTPNVLLLYMDDLRPELNTYGASHITSPNIDALANRAVQFNNAYSNVPVCGASRASMLTGLLPNKNRFINYNTFVEKETPNAVTLPQLFKENGYITISNGKVYHHLDDREDDWDDIWRPYAFEPNDKDLAPTAYWQSLWKDYQLSANKKVYKNTGTGPAFEKAPVADSTYIDGLMTEKVLRDLEKLQHSDKPFFLTAGFISPHLPFNAPSKHWELYERDSISLPKNNHIPTEAPQMSISNYPELRAYDNIPKQGEVQDSLAINLIHGYYATVSYTDALVGKILNKLKALQLDKNTIVILVSDHGYHLQENAQWAKFTNYKIASRVPLIIYNPKQPYSAKVDDLVSLVDIYPTLANLCNIKAPEHQLQGVSLHPYLRGEHKRVNNSVFIKRGNGYTIKTKDFAYTEYRNHTTDSVITKMLYDHRNDATEIKNVVNQDDYVQVVDSLKIKLQELIDKSNKHYTDVSKF